MKIAFLITRSDAVGGATLHVRDLCGSLIERGHEVTVLVGGQGPVTEEFAAAGVPFRPLRHLVRAIRPARDMRALLEIRSALVDLRPDLISIHTSKAGWLGRLVGHWLDIPTVFTPHGLSFGRGVSTPKRAIYTFAERLVGQFSEQMVTVSRAESELALRHRIVRPERLVTIHNGITDVPESLRATHRGTDVRLVTIARCQAPKDHRTLLRALGELESRSFGSRRWTLDWLGDGRLLDDARNLAVDLEIGDRVNFLGDRRNVEDFIAAADVFLLVSRSEGHPRSILEAMRARLPVVATDVGGCGESVVDGETGFLVPPGDSATLAVRLAELLDDVGLRVRMGDAGRTRYEDYFTLDSMAAKTVALYESIVSHNQPGARWRS